VAHALYIVHGSHPCVCAERALQLKGMPYRIVELPPTLHPPLQWLRFRKRTVPALVLGSGEQIVGSRAIVHRLDELVPEPRLLPEDPIVRARVEAAERWGDDVLQAAARRLFWAGLRRRPDALPSFAVGSRLPVPTPLLRLLAPVMTRLAGVSNSVTAARVRTDLLAVPGYLDQVDHWIAEGVLDGEQLNAADLQIGPSLRMLGTFGDVRPRLEGRPCWALAHRVVPSYAGSLPAGALSA
jgi:glutathione S-transferase